MGAGQSATEKAEQLRAKARKLDEAAEKWEQGSEGERRVAAALDRLPVDYVIFHDLQMPGSKANVDHLVIAPGGVFAIDAKNFSYPVTRGRGRGADRLWSGRYPVKLEPCKWEATKVEAAIGVPVQPMMCIIAPSTPASAFEFDGIQICRPNSVVREVTKTTGAAIDVAQTSELVARAFNAQPESRSVGAAPATAPLAQSAAPRATPNARRRRKPLSERLWIKPVGSLVGFFVVLAMFPLVVPIFGWMGTKLSERLLEDLVPTTVPDASSPATTLAAAPPSTVLLEPSTTRAVVPLAALGSPPPVPIETSCPNPGMGWVASFVWPGDLPDGASAYSIRWQLNGGATIRHDIGGWSDPTQEQVPMRVPNGAEQIFITDYLDADGQILTSTEQVFEVEGDC